MRVAFTIDLEQDAPPFLDTYRGAEEGMPRLLALLRDAGVAATVFTTGDVARRYPDLVREIVAGGHELGCHGDTHRAFDGMNEAEGAGEIARSSEVLRSFAPVRAFRAPYLRLPRRHLASLRANGYTIDSSEGTYKATGVRARVEDGLARIPATITSSLLRLPPPLARAARAVALAWGGAPLVLFVHPWELVDLRAMPIRWDCRAGTGDHAERSIARLLGELRAGGATFRTMSTLLEEAGREQTREETHDADGDRTHRSQPAQPPDHHSEPEAT